MPDSIWASIKTDWHARAVCAGANDYQFFPKIETAESLAKVRDSFCDHCPVRAKCLNSALINGDTGYWGGTSTAERMALKKARRRATCPLCGSKTLVSTVWTEGDLKIVDQSVIDSTVSVESFQVCLACGASWRSKSRLHLVQESQPVEAGSCP